MVLEVLTLNSDNTLQTASLLFAGFVVLVTLIGYWAQEERPYSGFKLVGKEPGEWGHAKAKQRYVQNAIQILKRGMDEVCESQNSIVDCVLDCPAGSRYTF